MSQTDIRSLIAEMRARAGAHSEGAEWIPAQPDLTNALDALESAVSQLDCMGSAVPQEVFSAIEAALKGGPE